LEKDQKNFVELSNGKLKESLQRFQDQRQKRQTVFLEELRKREETELQRIIASAAAATTPPETTESTSTTAKKI
jgi:hypothetical protein